MMIYPKGRVQGTKRMLIIEFRRKMRHAFTRGECTPCRFDKKFKNQCSHVEKRAEAHFSQPATANQQASRSAAIGRLVFWAHHQR